MKILFLCCFVFCIGWAFGYFVSALSHLPVSRPAPKVDLQQDDDDAAAYRMAQYAEGSPLGAHVTADVVPFTGRTRRDLH